MAEKEYDLIIVGAGPGGYVAAIRAAQLGLKVAIVDKNKSLGGTCANVGCIPSKALLHASEQYEQHRLHAAEMGILTSNLSLDFSVMQKRKEGIVGTLTGGVSALLKKNRVDVITGSASFISQDTVEVSVGKKKQTLQARHFIVATGSTPIELPFLPFDEKRVVSSTGALALKKVPKRMVVIGAGVIGLELASVYRRLGSEVVLVEMLPLPCAGMDKDLCKGALRIFKRQGLHFHLNTKVEKAKVGTNKIALMVSSGDDTATVEGDVVLVSVGRKPYTDGLGLEAAGISCDERGFIPVDDSLRTVVPTIYAIGDVVDGPMLAHRASEDGVAAAESIAGLTPHLDYVTVPNIVYTAPEIAGVGLSEEEAEQMGLPVFTGTFDLKASSRARCMGETDGFVKVVGDQVSGRLIGLHIMAHAAGEMIHEGAVAIAKGATVEEIANLSHGHPTLSEAIKEAALKALGRVIHS